MTFKFITIRPGINPFPMLQVLKPSSLVDLSGGSLVCSDAFIHVIDKHALVFRPVGFRVDPHPIPLPIKELPRVFGPIPIHRLALPIGRIIKPPAIILKPFSILHPAHPISHPPDHLPLIHTPILLNSPADPPHLPLPKHPLQQSPILQFHPANSMGFAFSPLPNVLPIFDLYVLVFQLASLDAFRVEVGEVGETGQDQLILCEAGHVEELGFATDFLELAVGEDFYGG